MNATVRTTIAIAATAAVLFVAIVLVAVVPVLHRLGREARFCSPTSGAITFTDAAASAARIEFSKNLMQPRDAPAARYISGFSLDRNTARVRLTSEGVRYFALGDATLLGRQGPMRVPLAATVAAAWMQAYSAAYRLPPEDDCDWLILYSPEGKELFRQRHFLAS